MPDHNKGQCECCIDGCCVPGNVTLHATIDGCLLVNEDPVELPPADPDDLGNSSWGGLEIMTCGPAGLSQCKFTWELACITQPGDPEHPKFVGQFYRDGGANACGNCDMVFGPTQGECDPIQVTFQVLHGGCTRCACTPDGSGYITITITE